jgi:hypothetical membrane protein
MNETSQQTVTRTKENLWALCGVIAPVFWTFMVIVESLLRPGYSQLSNYISDLGVGPNAILQNINFWVFGVLVFIFALGLGKSLPRSRGLVIALCLFAVGMFLAGVFPETSIPLGQHTNAHDLAGDLAFPSSIISQFLFWRRLGRTNEVERKMCGRSYKHYVLASTLTSAAFLIVLFVAESGSPYAGLAQRAFLAVPLLWLEVTAFKCFRNSLFSGIASTGKVHALCPNKSLKRTLSEKYSR